MGEIAEMMLNGTMDFETGEWNFEGEDGPGFPMTGSQAAEWRRGRKNLQNAPGTGSKKTRRRALRRQRAKAALAQEDTSNG